MALAYIAEERGVLRISGPDRVDFLQGLISNDVGKAAEHALWAAFLTPQGKFLHDFFLVEWNDALWLDCEAERLADLKKRLSIYRLRSKVEIADVSQDFAVALLFDAGALANLGLAKEPGEKTDFAGGLAFVDPRLAVLGARAILPAEGAEAALTETGFSNGDRTAYDALRLVLGLPDGSRDMEVDKAILLENGFDELGGVDWDKGCFMGQELTARTRYRALIKKRLLPVFFDQLAPVPGTALHFNGKEVGVVRSTLGQWGLSLLRLDRLGDLETARLDADGIEGRIELPDWVRLQSRD